MTTTQRIIKYLALSLAAFLIFIILSGILGTLYVVTSILGAQKEETNIQENMTTTDLTSMEITFLDIDVALTNLIIKNSDTLKVETNNQSINITQNNQTLKIQETNHDWLHKNHKGDLVLYLPKNMTFVEVKINAGAGKIEAKNINTENLYLELGTGKTTFENLDVLKNCTIKSGIGKASILSGSINELDLNMGIGKFEITSNLTGNSKIEAGIGSLNIDILNTKENYQIKATKGIGTIKIGNETIPDNYTYGSGANKLTISGGIGSIDVDFER